MGKEKEGKNINEMGKGRRRAILPEDKEKSRGKGLLRENHRRLGRYTPKCLFLQKSISTKTTRIGVSLLSFYVVKGERE